MASDFFIELGYHQLNHEGERICGDVFLSKHIPEENRIVLVLSDGMGHGVKANVLANLTATMALNFTIERKENLKIAEIIMNTLPVCSVRKISYATFTIMDIQKDGDIKILEFDNPKTIIVRDGELFEPEWEEIELESGQHKGKKLRTCVFTPQKSDRLFATTDGVTQSGLGSDQHPFGWGEEDLAKQIRTLVKSQPDMDAKRLADKVVRIAHSNDRLKAKDDISCACIYFREPRKLLFCTGPPYEKEKDEQLGNEVKNFPGKKIISGATTGDIIARELGVEIEDGFDFTDDELPPISYMPGIDLYTEGILTLGKVAEKLKEHDQTYKFGSGPADQVIKLLLESDEINFIIGTRINIAHQDPNLPVELEIRRTVVKRIASLLESKFIKQVHVKYI